MTILNFGSRGLSFFARTYEKGTWFLCSLLTSLWPFVVCHSLSLCWFIVVVTAMANMEDQNVTVSLSDSAVWDPGNHSNTSSALLSRPICLTMPLIEAATQDFLACADGGNPYLTACYVRKDIMTCFKNWTIFLFSLHLLRHLEFWEKLQFLPLSLGSS